MILKRCHLCGKDMPFIMPIIELRGMPKAAQYYPEPHEFIDDTGIDLKIYQCPSCGLVQHNMEPVDYYREVITAASLSGDSRTSRLNQMKDLSRRFNLKGKKILDVGAGKGLMLDVLKEAEFKPTGIEAGEYSVLAGQFEGRNLIKGYIGNISKVPGGPFDAFISLNYLEHLPQPGDIIKKICNNLTPDGVGFVTVPNLEYLLKTKSFYEFVADHISYFTQKTLTFAFESNGFDVLDCKLINNDNDIAVIVKKKKQLNLTEQYVEVELLIKNLQKIIAEYKSQNKKIAVWGAGHRTLALLALAKAFDIEYIIDDAKFKQGKFIPILHLPIVSSEYLRKNKVNLVIVMVPGIYPDNVITSLKNMKLKVEIAKLIDNKIKFI